MQLFCTILLAGVLLFLVLLADLLLQKLPRGNWLGALAARSGPRMALSSGVGLVLFLAGVWLIGRLC